MCIRDKYVPGTSAVVPASAEPPVDELYHCHFAPAPGPRAIEGSLLLPTACGLVAVGNGFLVIRRPPRSTLDRSSAASDVYKRQPGTSAVVPASAEPPVDELY